MLEGYTETDFDLSLLGGCKVLFKNAAMGRSHSLQYLSHVHIS